MAWFSYGYLQTIFLNARGLIRTQLVTGNSQKDNTTHCTMRIAVMGGAMKVASSIHTKMVFNSLLGSTSSSCHLMT